MTEDRRSKQAIRERMAQTGEKYTAARRALLGAGDLDRVPDPVARRPSAADGYLAELGPHHGSWISGQAAHDVARSEDVPEDLRELDLLRTAAQPVTGVVIKLSILGFPGSDLGADAEWAAMLATAQRNLLALRRAGLGAQRVDPHLGLLDLIEARIGHWPESEWLPAVRGRVQALVHAWDGGRRRGEQRTVQPASGEPPDGWRQAWELRHPADHYLRAARPRTTDPAFREYVDQQTAAISKAYEVLASGDWHAAEAAADVVIDVEIAAATPSGWKVPVPIIVTRPQRGAIEQGTELGLRLVADPGAPFNGTRLSVLGGERWRICGTHLGEGTLLPGDGSRRLADR